MYIKYIYNYTRTMSTFICIILQKNGVSFTKYLLGRRGGIFNTYLPASTKSKAIEIIAKYYFKKQIQV